MPGAATPAVFQGFIEGTVLTVTPIPGLVPVGIEGTIAFNSPLFGLTSAPGTMITGQISGSPAGGVGTYRVSTSQNVETTMMSTGIDVVAGQQNRAAEPNNPYFVVITPMLFKRMSTNVDAAEDCKFTASIASTTMTVSAVAIGELEDGATVFGAGVSAGTVIIEQLTGSPGGPGTYEVVPSQTVSSGTLSAGTKTMTQNAIATVQVDFHAPDTTGGDLAQIFSTAFRDEFATSFFAALSAPLNGVSPIEADDPKQVPFINAENQYEWRWSVDCKVDIDQVVAVPQQYADAATVTVTDVTAAYPPD